MSSVDPDLEVLALLRNTPRLSGRGSMLLALAFLLTMVSFVPIREVRAEPYDPSLARAYRGWTIESLEILGLEDALASALKKGLQLSGKETLLGRERAQFYPIPLQADLARTRLFLSRRGFPRARVSLDLTPLPRERKLELKIEIDPGPPVLLGSIEVEGVPAELRKDVRTRIPLRRGQRFDEAQIESAENFVRVHLASDGYARARVSTKLTTRGESAEDPVNVTLLSVPGPRCSFGRVVVDGTQKDLTPLAKRVLGVERGMLYAPSRVQSAEDRLRSLGLFRQVRIEVKNEAGFDSTAAIGVVELHCRLIDQFPRRIETGLGFRTDELLRVRAKWEHRNLFRKGRGANVSGLYSQRRQNLKAGLWWPALFKINVRAELAGRFERLFEEGFDSEERGTRLSLGYRPSFVTSYDLGIELLQFSIDSKSDFEEFEYPEEILIELSALWANNRVDDRLNPSRGHDTWVHAKTLIPTAFSDSRFFSLESSYSHYFRLTQRSVIATRVRGGWAEPWGHVSELAPSNRFLAGGVTSMRGFRHSRLGPVDPDGTPLGGEAKLEIGWELRVPIWKGLRAAVFADAGQVWADRHKIRIDQLEYAVGPALILGTPIGPIRGDVGFRLTDIVADQPVAAFHIAIGHPF